MIKRFIIGLCFLAIANLAAAALPPWYKGGDLSGLVVNISASKIALVDKFFKLSPTVKVSSLKEARVPLKRVKKNQKVRLKFIKINGKKMVDHIYIMPKFVR